MLLVAQEFLDAFPVHQFEYTGKNKHSIRETFEECEVCDGWQRMDGERDLWMLTNLLKGHLISGIS